MTVEQGSDESATEPRDSVSPSGARAALIVFVSVCGMVLVLVPVLARHQWFTFDEWGVLGATKAGSLDDLLTPHNDHWSTLPILVYRGLFALFGLRTYLPYQLAAVLVHLATAALLRTAIRRAGVNPWVATAVASVYAFLGAGWQNIIWGWQISLVGALAFGVTQLILLDHDGPLDRRDWFGLVAGLLGLLCSGVALTMVLVVGVAALTRRGWRVAFFHAAPLTVVYGAWYLTYGHERNLNFPTARDHPGLLVRWFGRGVLAIFDALGHFRVAGIAIAVLAVVGLVLAWGPLDKNELRRRAAIPGALLFGSFAFILLTGWARVVAYQPAYARASRYVDIATGMALPAVAVGLDAVVRRWRFFAPVLLAMLLVAIPGNLRQFHHSSSSPFWASTQVRYRRSLLALANVPVAANVPRTILPDRVMNLIPPGTQFPITLGWLLDQKNAGRLPKIQLTAQERADATIRLALHQSRDAGIATACHSLATSKTIQLARDRSISFDKGILAVEGTYPASGDDTPSSPLKFDPAQGKVLTALLGPLTVRMSPDRSSSPVEVCEYSRVPDPATVVPGSISVAEGNSGQKVVQVPLTLSVPSDRAVTASWATREDSAVAPDDLAVAPDDYTSAAGTVTFLPGQTSKTVPVALKGDVLDESDEVILVSFTDATNANIGGFFGLGFVTITDDD